MQTPPGPPHAQALFNYGNHQTVKTSTLFLQCYRAQSIGTDSAPGLLVTLNNDSAHPCSIKIIFSTLVR